MDWLYRIIQLLFGTLLVVLLAYLTTRMVGSKAAGLGRGRYTKVLDRVMLGNNKWIYIVQVGREYFLLGVSNQSIEYLGTLTEEAMIPLDVEQPLPFNNILDQYMTRWAGSRKENEADGKKAPSDPLQRMKTMIGRHRELLKQEHPHGRGRLEDDNEHE